MSDINKIKIGGFSYAVEYIKDLCDEDGKLDGRINNELALVQIEVAMNDQMKVQSIIHEALHSIFFQIGRQDLNKKEDLVDSLAFSIFQVLRDNPDFIKSILEL
ncbi:MAG TPA: hypothetical protein VIY48_16035 [Candidatus Paceibacterota bacterium]